MSWFSPPHSFKILDGSFSAVSTPTAVAVVGAKRQLWFEAYIFSHSVVVGRVAFGSLASLLPLDFLWKTDRLQAAHVKHAIVAPSSQSRHIMHLGRENMGRQLPILVADAGIIPWARDLLTALLGEGDRGRVARATGSLAFEMDAPEVSLAIVEIVRRLATYGLYIRDLRGKRVARVLDGLAGPAPPEPRSYRSKAPGAANLEVPSPTSSI